ncbi:MAG: ATP-binding cassette domain-containing protein, partial [Actinobacteria bacterium]
MAAASSETDGAGDIVLDVTGLSWGVGGLVILEGIDLEVRAGEFISIIGPNGAGKTSLINV